LLKKEERERERERGKKKHEHDGPVVLLPPALSAGAAAHDEPSARAPASGQWVRGWRGLQSPPQRRFCPSMLNSFAARIVGSSTQAGVECEKASFLSISKNVSRTRFEASHLFTTSHAHFNSQENYGTDEEERQGRVDARRGRSSSFFLLTPTSTSPEASKKIQLLPSFSELSLGRFLF
jgi:hypothetical protein